MSAMGSKPVVASLGGRLTFAETNRTSYASWMKRLIGTALVGVLVGCATPQREGLTSLTIMQRPSYGICAGYCPNLDVIVREDGQVTVSKHHFEAPDEIRRVQVTTKQAALLSRMLEPYRPRRGDTGPVDCRFWNSADPLVLKVHPYRVVWTNADGGTSELRACGDAKDAGLPEAMRAALWSIGLYMGGEPRH
jgi:hypothetical protein